MNDSEQRAYNWLLKRGIRDITYHARQSPDFITASGEKYEVKKIRNNIIWFSPYQYEVLSNISNVTIIVMNDKDAPVATFPFNEIKDGYWKDIKVKGTAGNWKMVNIRVDPDLWKSARIQALKENKTLEEWLTEAIKEKMARKEARK